MSDVLEIGRRAKAAAARLATTPTAVKDAALGAIADALVERADQILVANTDDLERGRADGLSEGLLDRLALTPERIEGIAQALRDVTKLTDPVGEVIDTWTQPNGVRFDKVRVPLGVIGDHLRGAPQRHGRRGRPVPQERQRGDPAGVVERDQLEHSRWRRSSPRPARARGCPPDSVQLSGRPIARAPRNSCGCASTSTC